MEVRGEAGGAKKGGRTRSGINRAARWAVWENGTHRIFRERQLSHARWVLVRFLLSTRGAAEPDPTRWMSEPESAPSSSDALLFTPSWAYFLFRLPVAGGGAEEEEACWFESGWAPVGGWYMIMPGYWG